MLNQFKIFFETFEHSGTYLIAMLIVFLIYITIFLSLRVFLMKQNNSPRESSKLSCFFETVLMFCLSILFISKTTHPNYSFEVLKHLPEYRTVYLTLLSPAILLSVYALYCGLRKKTAKAAIILTLAITLFCGFIDRVSTHYVLQFNFKEQPWAAKECQIYINGQQVPNKQALISPAFLSQVTPLKVIPPHNGLLTPHSRKGANYRPYYYLKNDKGFYKFEMEMNGEKALFLEQRLGEANQWNDRGSFGFYYTLPSHEKRLDKCLTVLDDISTTYNDLLKVYPVSHTQLYSLINKSYIASKERRQLQEKALEFIISAPKINNETITLLTVLNANHQLISLEEQVSEKLFEVNKINSSEKAHKALNKITQLHQKTLKKADEFTAHPRLYRIYEPCLKVIAQHLSSEEITRLFDNIAIESFDRNIALDENFKFGQFYSQDLSSIYVHLLTLKYRQGKYDFSDLAQKCLDYTESIELRSNNKESKALIMAMHLDPDLTFDYLINKDYLLKSNDPHHPQMTERARGTVVNFWLWHLAILKGEKVHQFRLRNEELFLNLAEEIISHKSYDNDLNSLNFLFNDKAELAISFLPQYEKLITRKNKALKEHWSYLCKINSYISPKRYLKFFNPNKYCREYKILESLDNDSTVKILSTLLAKCTQVKSRTAESNQRVLIEQLLKQDLSNQQRTSAINKYLTNSQMVWLPNNISEKDKIEVYTKRLNKLKLDNSVGSKLTQKWILEVLENLKRK